MCLVCNEYVLRADISVENIVRVYSVQSICDRNKNVNADTERNFTVLLVYKRFIIRSVKELHNQISRIVYRKEIFNMNNVLVVFKFYQNFRFINEVFSSVLKNTVLGFADRINVIISGLAVCTACREILLYRAHFFGKNILCLVGNTKSARAKNSSDKKSFRYNRSRAQGKNILAFCVHSVSAGAALFRFGIVFRKTVGTYIIFSHYMSPSLE